jgi:hypothetical protein
MPFLLGCNLPITCCEVVIIAIRIQVASQAFRSVYRRPNLLQPALCDQFSRSASKRFLTALSTHAAANHMRFREAILLSSPMIYLLTDSSPSIHLGTPSMLFCILKSCGHIELQVRESKVLVKRLSSGKQSACMAAA